VNNTTATGAQCPQDRLLPTSTTACDVPGTPMMLQYDPSIPLYNYGNYAQNRSFAVIESPLDAVYVQYTKNIVEYIETETDSVYPDASLVYQTFTTQLGSLIIGNNGKDVKYTFNISTPVAIWIKGSINSGYDTNGNRIVKPAVVSTDSLDLHVTGLTFQILYNETIVTPLVAPTVSYSFNDCSFNLKTIPVPSGFYAVQYIGMLHIRGLVLQTPPQTVYSLQIVTNYTYDNMIANKLDYTKTGVYANLDVVTDPTYVYNCVLSSTPPSDFAVGTFEQFQTTT
jgi:hypothetical protein